MRFVAIFGALAAPRIVFELGERRTFYLMAVVLIASYVLLAAGGSIYAQVAFLSMNFIWVMSQPVLTDYVNKRVPSEQRATADSLTNLSRSPRSHTLRPAHGRAGRRSFLHRSRGAAPSSSPPSPCLYSFSGSPSWNARHNVNPPRPRQRPYLATSPRAATTSSATSLFAFGPAPATL